MKAIVLFYILSALQHAYGPTPVDSKRYVRGLLARTGGASLTVHFFILTQ